MATFSNTSNEKSSKSSSNFYCEICQYNTVRKSNYIKHLTTLKHINSNTLATKVAKSSESSKIYYCDICSKEYLDRSGLWRHKKNCKNDNCKNDNCNNCDTEINNSLLNKDDLEEAVRKMVANSLTQCGIVNQNNTNNTNTNNMLVSEAAITADTISMIVKQNQDFQKEIIGQIMEFMKASNNINNGIINNGHFNLQVYLNETCKNAMTLNQFLDYIQPTIQQLEDTAILGYVEGISRIILQGFKNLEEEELPFHCTDLKREHIFVKNPDDEWVEEKDEKPLLLRFIKEVARKSFNNLSAWQKQNPQWANYHSKQNDMFNKIVNNSMSGETEKEQQENYNKIMKNIMKNIVIDKNKIKNKNK